MAKRLYRSTTDVVIAGVCGGLGKYLGIDPVIIRVFFVLGIWAGLSLFAYPLLWVIIPREDRADATVDETIQVGAAEIGEKARSFGVNVESRSDLRKLASMFVGAVLVLVGINLLAETAGLTFLRWVNFDLVWPALLIVGGFALITRRTRVA